MQKTWFSEKASNNVGGRKENWIDEGSTRWEQCLNGCVELAMAVKTNCSHCKINKKLWNKKNVWSLKQVCEIRCYCK